MKIECASCGRRFPTPLAVADHQLVAHRATRRNRDHLAELRAWEAFSAAHADELAPVARRAKRGARMRRWFGGAK